MTLRDIRSDQVVVSEDKVLPLWFEIPFRLDEIAMMGEHRKRMADSAAGRALGNAIIQSGAYECAEYGWPRDSEVPRAKVMRYEATVLLPGPGSHPFAAEIEQAYRRGLTRAAAITQAMRDVRAAYGGTYGSTQAIILETATAKIISETQLPMPAPGGEREWLRPAEIVAGR